MISDFKFRVIILNFEIQGSMSTRGVVSVSVLNFVCCNRNAIVFACIKISRCFANHSSKILIRKIDKFYTGATMIILKNRRQLRVKI